MLNQTVIARAEERYVREYDRYLKLAHVIASECETLVRSSGIPASVQFRAKDPVSLSRKLHRYLHEDNQDKIIRIADVDQVFDIIGDLAGVRIATYVEADRERVVELIRQHFPGPLPDTPVIVERKAKESGYRATHCQVAVPKGTLSGVDGRNLANLTCEIQVCSMLAHVWNEIEHDIRYKLSTVSDVSPFEGILLDNFLEKTLEGDELIEQILVERSTRVAAGMARDVGLRFDGLEHFEVNALEVLREAVRLGYDACDRLGEELLQESYVERGIELVGVFNGRIKALGSTMRLDPSSADVLLALLLERHAADLRALHYRELQSDQAKRVARIADLLERAMADTPAAGRV